jgi:Putative peptidoglycan binding domain
MSKNAGGIGFLVLMGLMAVGLADRDGTTEATADAGLDATDTLAVCDGALAIETTTGSARLPADIDPLDPLDPDATVVCGMEIGAGDDDAVAALQQALAQCHGQPVTVDGRYGPQTAAGVTAVQEQAGLAPDGEYDQATMAAMQWPLTGASQAGACGAIGSDGAIASPSPTLPVTG